MSVIRRGSSEYTGMIELEGGHIACAKCQNPTAWIKSTGISSKTGNIQKSVLRCECGNIITVETELHKGDFWESNLKGMFQRG
jgi:hypothetical protein